MKMRKIITLITAVAMIGAITTGCGKKEDSGTLSDEQVSAAVSNAVDWGYTPEEAEEIISELEKSGDLDEVTSAASDKSGSDLRELDVFENIALDYDGFTPLISVSVNTDNMKQFVKDNVVFKVSPDSGLSNGDTVTITAMYSTSVMEENGYAVAADVMEMTVEGSEHTADDLTTIDLLDYVYIMSTISYDEGETCIIPYLNSYNVNDKNDQLRINDLCLYPIIEYNGEEMDSGDVPIGEKCTIRIKCYDNRYIQANGIVFENDVFEITAWKCEENCSNIVMYRNSDGEWAYTDSPMDLG